MEVLFMNQAFETTRIVDAFQSLIWTVNYIGYGEFELRLPMSDNALAGIRIDWYASIRESDRYMIVEAIEISTSLEDGNVATIRGRSLESILDRRVVLNDEILAGSISSCVARLLNENLIQPSDGRRRISKLSSKLVANSDTNKRINVAVSAGDNVYDLIYDICNAYHIGFRILPYEDGGMVFELYSGADRSYNQEKNPWVVFSPQFENIKDTVMSNDATSMRNTIYGRSEFTMRVQEWNSATQKYDTVSKDYVVNSSLNGDISGLERREMFHKSNLKGESLADISVFGNPEDMVDIMDYCTYQLLRFDSAGYEAAIREYNQKLEEAYVPRKKDEEVREWHWYQPGEEGYNEEYADYINVPGLNGYWYTAIKPGDTVEQWEAANKKYFDIAENEYPDRSSFYEYGWTFDHEVEYNAAVEEARKQIQANYQAMINSRLTFVKQGIDTEIKEKLAPYLIIGSFEGELDPNVQFIFGEAYDLGDLVQIVNEFHFQAVTRVVSITITEEVGSGVVVYPSFESDDKAVFQL